jgi:hypothetical protein
MDGSLDLPKGDCMKNVLALFIFAGCAFAQVPGMVGSWKLDVASSNADVVDIDHSATVKVESVSAGNGMRFLYGSGDSLSRETLVIDLDGYEHPTGRPNELSAARQLGGGVFVRYERTEPSSGLVYLEMWKLSKDGSTLTRSRQSGDGAANRTSTLVFRRATAQ